MFENCKVRLTRKIEPEGIRLDFPEDVARLRREIESRGYMASDADIAWAYERFSDDHYCAGWLIFTDGQIPGIVDAMLRMYLTPEKPHEIS